MGRYAQRSCAVVEVRSTSGITGVLGNAEVLALGSSGCHRHTIGRMASTAEMSWLQS